MDAIASSDASFRLYVPNSETAVPEQLSPHETTTTRSSSYLLWLSPTLVQAVFGDGMDSDKPWKSDQVDVVEWFHGIINRTMPELADLPPDLLNRILEE